MTKKFANGKIIYDSQINKGVTNFYRVGSVQPNYLISNTKQLKSSHILLLEILLLVIGECLKFRFVDGFSLCQTIIGKGER